MQFALRSLFSLGEIAADLGLSEPDTDTRWQHVRFASAADLQIDADELPMMEAVQFPRDCFDSDPWRVCVRHFSNSIGLRASDGRPCGLAVHSMLRPALVASLHIALTSAQEGAR